MDLDAETVEEIFGLAAESPPPEVRATWNAAPGTAQLVVGTDRARARRAGRYVWGFVPHWARDPAAGHRPINARAETVETRPTFRDAFRTGRCLVPATGFYEWDSVSGTKQPWFYTVDDGAPFAFAGLLSRRRLEDGGILRTFCVITTEPNALAARVHDRMPAIVDPSGYAEWLAGADADPRALAAMLRPFPADRMRAWPVSRRVNRPAEDGPSLVDPVAEPPADA